MAVYMFDFLLIFPIINCKNHAKTSSWGFRMLVKYYMSKLEQFMCASEQKEKFLRLPTLLRLKLYAG